MGGEPFTEIEGWLSWMGGEPFSPLLISELEAGRPLRRKRCESHIDLRARVRTYGKDLLVWGSCGHRGQPWPSGAAVVIRLFRVVVVVRVVSWGQIGSIGSVGSAGSAGGGWERLGPAGATGGGWGGWGS